MLEEMSRQFDNRSRGMLTTLEGGLPRIMTVWLITAILASAARVLTSPGHSHSPSAGAVLPYLLLTIAPLVSISLALRWFAHGDRLAQPVIRLARVGRWRSVSPADARANPYYGTTGLMLSLLIGMLINVPVRAAEYLAAMPALTVPVPRWLSVLHLMMTLDVVLLSCLYVIAFVAALRRVPLFPRLLVAIWMIDLAMQMGIAQAVGSTGDVPAEVAGPLLFMLDGNVKKVLISVVLWAPYLLLSRRVNVTFRNRVPE